MNSLVFISSMFRSGTTLIARMLNVHPQVVCASDPMRPLVNSFRYDMADDSYRAAHRRFDPLDDYFIEHARLLETILSADLSCRIGCPAEELVSTVQARAEMFSGLYARELSAAGSFKDYAGAVTTFLSVIEACYGAGRDPRVTAFKEVWSTEFYPALRRSFPGAKCMVIMRDPRSVVASKIATGEPYPHLFMGRQWRKLACLADYVAAAFPDDVLLFRYEDFVREPEEYVRRICGWMGVDFTQDLLDGNRYRDGWNQPWVQNTSYSGAGAKRINAGTMDKWKSVLTREDIASIELFTHDWMMRFGYEPVYTPEELLALDPGLYRRFELDELAGWIRPYARDADPVALAGEVRVEKLRLSANVDAWPARDRMSVHKAWW